MEGSRPAEALKDEYPREGGGRYISAAFFSGLLNARLSSSGIKKIETIHWNGDINDRPAHQKAIDDVSFQINQASKEGRPVVIISHSKGGLIAYESALSLDPKNSKSKVMLVTLNTNEHLVYDGGSQSKALPANVNWVNEAAEKVLFPAPRERVRV